MSHGSLSIPRKESPWILDAGAQKSEREFANLDPWRAERRSGGVEKQQEANLSWERREENPRRGAARAVWKNTGIWMDGVKGIRGWLATVGEGCGI